jgi:hypothetical protein
LIKRVAFLAQAEFELGSARWMQRLRPTGYGTGLVDTENKPDLNLTCNGAGPWRHGGQETELGAEHEHVERNLQGDGRGLRSYGSR